MVNKSMYKSITAELSPHQSGKVSRAVKGKTVVSINLTKDQLESKYPNYRFYISNTQYNRYNSFMAGSITANSLRLNLSPSQLSHSVQLKADLRVMPLSNLNVDEIMRNKPWYKGTYMQDELMQQDIWQLETYGITINLDDMDGPGTHWVGLARKDGGVPFYFDSYGLPPSDDIYRWATQGMREPRMKWSRHQIQKQKSVKCGYFTIEWLETFFESDSENAIRKFDFRPSDKNERIALEK